MGDVIGDLNSRRGHIQSMDERHGIARRRGNRSTERDVRLRGRFAQPDPRSCELLRCSSIPYAQVPNNVAEEIIAKARVNNAA